MSVLVFQGLLFFLVATVGAQSPEALQGLRNEIEWAKGRVQLIEDLDGWQDDLQKDRRAYEIEIQRMRAIVPAKLERARFEGKLAMIAERCHVEWLVADTERTARQEYLELRLELELRGDGAAYECFFSLAGRGVLSPVNSWGDAESTDGTMRLPVSIFAVPFGAYPESRPCRDLGDPNTAPHGVEAELRSELAGLCAQIDAGRELLRVHDHAFEARRRITLMLDMAKSTRRPPIVPNPQLVQLSEPVSLMTVESPIGVETSPHDGVDAILRGELTPLLGSGECGFRSVSLGDYISHVFSDSGVLSLLFALGASTDIDVVAGPLSDDTIMVKGAFTSWAVTLARVFERRGDRYALEGDLLMAARQDLLLADAERSSSCIGSDMFDEQELSLSWTRKPLDEAARLFSELVGVDIALDSGVDGEISAWIESTPPGRALTSIAAVNGLVCTVKGGGVLLHESGRRQSGVTSTPEEGATRADPRREVVTPASLDPVLSEVTIEQVGVAGILTVDRTLAVLESRGTYYIACPNSRLADGSVKHVHSGSVVFVRDEAGTGTVPGETF